MRIFNVQVFIWFLAFIFETCAISINDVDIVKNPTSFAKKQIEAAALANVVLMERIQDLTATWTNATTIISQILQLHPDDPSPLSASQLTLFLHAKWDEVAGKVRDELELPLPEAQTERYNQRQTLIDTVLNMTENALVEASIKFHLTATQDEIREQFKHIKLEIRHVIPITWNLINEYPFIAEFILFAFLPEDVIMIPIIRLFGISTTGLVKGSLAALAQAFFFGGKIPKNSWFSKLQKTGMAFKWF